MSSVVFEEKPVMKKIVTFGHSLFPFFFCFFCVSLFLILTISMISGPSLNRFSDTKIATFTHYNTRK